MFTIHIQPNDSTNGPAGKLADAELRFTDGDLAGLRLIGFAIWERRSGTGRNVTFPARAYSVNGERRSYALLRPQDGKEYDVQAAIRDRILQAFANYEALIEEAEGSGAPPAANGFTFGASVSK